MTMRARATVRPFTHEHYAQMLTSGLENGYQFISFSQLGNFRHGEPVCCLRHDCDNDLVAADAMARLEEEMKVHSTYFPLLRSPMYNPLSIPNSELIHSIIGRGHEIGLHFDEQCYPGATAAQVAAHVEWERALLSREFGVPVNVVSFHQPSCRILANELKIRCMNTYDQTDMQGLHYISDTNAAWKQESPSEVFSKRSHSRLQLLIHPEWWTIKEMTLLEKWNQMLSNNFELMQGSLLKREAAYRHQQKIAFEALESRK